MAVCKTVSSVIIFVSLDITYVNPFYIIYIVLSIYFTRANVYPNLITVKIRKARS